MAEPGPTSLDREELALRYLEQLPFTPYPVQERALYAWFESREGVLVCTPTGTGKTLIAEAAAYEALHNGSICYYTTPLIALTEQKFLEMQEAAERWGFSRTDVGLVTGNRRVNPQARILVVVAEILLNRLLQPETFDFGQVASVVMDEFHSFADQERGIVWEFALGLLPKHVRLLLLSATVGNAVDFLSWLGSSHQRRLELVQSTDRKIPLSFHWVPDQLLTEQLEFMAEGDAERRRTPALVFCFNREECWSVAEELKGRSMLAEGQQKQLAERLQHHDWSKGAGPKLKQLLLRGVGVHHAGLLPRYRRIVEELFQRKLLTICVCTETLSAGINLPARSVVLPSLMKGPAGKQKLVDASTAHQIFGRAGRPQFDAQGFVYALPHEDDVRIVRWKEKYDQIPEDTRDPQLIKAKKALKKKMPTRSPHRQYWTAGHFERLRTAPARELASQGALPWRMLAYMLQLSPDVERVRTLVSKRLMEPKRLAEQQEHLHHMLRILHAAGVVRLEPEPPSRAAPAIEEPSAPPVAAPPKPSALAQAILDAMQAQHAATGTGPVPIQTAAAEKPPEYRPQWAHPTDRMREFFVFRSVNPVYALFLLDMFGRADPIERLQALESVLELPTSMLRYVRVPKPEDLPPGRLAREYLDGEIVTRGILSADDLYPAFDPDLPLEERKYPPPFAEKLRLLFESEYPRVHGAFVRPVWAAAELLQFGSDFQAYVSSNDLAKQEGLIFRHLLRLVLLLGEFGQVTPQGMDPGEWQAEVRDLSERFTAACRTVDPQSTDYMLEHATDQDLARPEGAVQEDAPQPPVAPASSGEAAAASAKATAAGEHSDVPDAPESPAARALDDFGAGIFDEE